MNRYAACLLVTLTALTTACQTVPTNVAEGVPLEGTHWRLTHLGERPVAELSLPREAHIFLLAGDRRVTGSGGCNRLIGDYRLSGRQLNFGALISTRMACTTGMAGELAVFAALERSQGYVLAGSRLDLTDAEGRRLARFEAGTQP